MPHAGSAVARERRLEAVLAWDASPRGETALRWSEVAPPAIPKQLLVSVDVADGATTTTGIAGLTYYAEPGRTGPSFGISDLLADWWPTTGGGLGGRPSDGQSPYDPEGARLSALVELAILDALGRQSGLPAAAFLGVGSRDRLPAYASLPSFPDPHGALAQATAAVEEGFRGVKFHAAGFLDVDLETIRAARRELGPSLALMWDASCAYDLDTAEKVGRALSEEAFLWFEAPLADDATEALRRLSGRVSIPLVPDGMAQRSSGEWVRDLGDGIWGALRVDATRARSIRAALSLVYLAESLGFPCEIQSFGFPLSQYANLQLMLATPSCRFFEAPFPQADLEDELVAAPSIEDGFVLAPLGAGLAHDLEPERLSERAELIARTP